jgi:hypothetical protein
MDGSIVIFILYCVSVLAFAGYWVSLEISHRWRAWHRERMTAWQRRVSDQQQPPPGFEVISQRKG